MSEIEIRFAGEGDADALASMIDAMEAYYHDPPRRPDEAQAAVRGWLADGETDTHFVLALDGDKPLGFLALAVLHPGNELKGLVFLKDVFVTAEARGQRIGEGLMRFLASFCRDQGIGRIDWVVETPESQRFYERLGAVTKPEKLYMRLDGAALADLAGE